MTLDRGRRGVELVDTHAHLDFEAFAGDRDAVLERARAAGVRAVVDVALRPDAVPAVLDLCERAGDVWAAVGVHPLEVAALAHDLDAQWERLEAYLAHPRVVAVGETGIDLHRPGAPLPVQRAAFEAQLELAARAGLPVIVHQRRAEEPVLEVLAAWRHRLPAVILHCFTGGPELARRCCELDVYFGLGGVLTFPNAEDLRRAVREVLPPDRLLLETDAPFLAPQPRRGSRNEPAFLVHVVEVLAGLLGVTPGEAAALTSANARRALPRLTAGDET